jgi:hypothetical protein
MMRILLHVIVPLLTPFLVYAIWYYVDAQRQGRGQPNWEEGNWFWVTIVGSVLVAASLGYLASRGGEPGSQYQAPRYEDGIVVPGKMQPAKIEPGNIE